MVLMSTFRIESHQNGALFGAMYVAEVTKRIYCAIVARFVTWSDSKASQHRNLYHISGPSHQSGASIELHSNKPP